MEAAIVSMGKRYAQALSGVLPKISVGAGGMYRSFRFLLSMGLYVAKSQMSRLYAVLFIPA